MAIMSSVWQTLKRIILANINSTNNKFYYGNEEIIPKDRTKCVSGIWSV